MACLICGAETPQEVCNKCIRTEQKKFEKEWIHKEGFLGSKKEDCKVLVSDVRISGIALICTSDSGINGRFDNFNHYIGNVETVKKGTYNNKPCIIVHIKNKTTGMERFLFFPSIPDETNFETAIKNAK